MHQLRFKLILSELQLNKNKIYRSQHHVEQTTNTIIVD